MTSEISDTPSPLKIAIVDLMCKEHIFRDPEEFLEKRKDSAFYVLSKQNSIKEKYNLSFLYLTRKEGGYKKEINGISHHFIQARPYSYPNDKYHNMMMYSKEIEDRTLELKPDLVHIMQTYGKNLYRYCAFLKSNGIRYILHYRGGNLKKYGLRTMISVYLHNLLHLKKLSYFDRKRKKVFMNASGIIVNNEEQKKNISDVLPISDRIFIISPGIYLENFRPLEKKYERLIFGFVGRISKEKGIISSIEILDFLKKHGIHFKYNIAGSFDNISKEHLFNICKEKGIEIEYYGFLSGDELSRFYNEMTFLLFLSESESFGKVIVEAMSCGAIPIIQKGSGGPEKIITDRINGIVLNKDDLDELLKLIVDKDKIKEFSDNAIIRSKDFSMRNFISNIDNVWFSSTS